MPRMLEADALAVAVYTAGGSVEVVESEAVVVVESVLSDDDDESFAADGAAGGVIGVTL